MGDCQVNVYEGYGPDKGKVIIGDSDALGYAMEMCGIEPTEGIGNMLDDFKKELLQWYYSDHWETHRGLSAEEVREKWW